MGNPSIRLIKSARVAVLRPAIQLADIAWLTFLLLLFAALPAHADTTSQPLGLDDMMANFIKNINKPIVDAVYAGCYTFGTYLFMKGFFKCIKYSDEGSKGQQKFSGIWGTFAVAGMLLALPSSVGDVSSSLTFEHYASGTQAALGYAGNSAVDPAVGAKMVRTYWMIITFVQMIGLISFVRGLSILRSVTDGNTQVTSMAGITHIVAGAIAWNLGDFVQMFGNTVGCANLLTTMSCT